MSDIKQRTKRKSRKFQCRIWFSYILFSSLIVFNILLLLNAIEPLVSRDSMDQSTDNSSKVEMKNHTSEEEAIIRILVRDFQAENKSLDLMAMKIAQAAMTEVQWFKEVTKVILEVVAIAILLLCDLLALLGLKRRQTCLLVPWMIVYFTGLCWSYFRALVLLLEQVFEMDDNSPPTSKILYPLSTVIVLNLAWVFVFSTCKGLKRNQQEGLPGPTVV